MTISGTTLHHYNLAPVLRFVLPGEPFKIFGLRHPLAGIGSDHKTDSHRVDATTPVMCQQFDPLALMCRLASTLCPLTWLDALSHRVFF